MNLWLRAHFMVALLFLRCSALTPEECQPLVKPTSLDSMIHEKLYFLMAYAEQDTYKNILKVTDSSWVKITASPSAPRQVVMSQENRINGSCFASSVNVSIESDSATVSLANITTYFQVLPSCEGCVVFSGNSTLKNHKKILDFMKISSVSDNKEFSSGFLYFLAKEPTVKASDLEHFKQQADCLGFSGEPDFYYNQEKSFCQEGEGVRLPFP
ncbi:uncharacterized protein LOC125019774 [Mugil cephalus]|nr:uncharacterized protein LOC125019774 [Mugil cephalus]